MIKIVNNFDLKGSLFSGQCFRMFEKDGYFYKFPMGFARNPLLDIGDEYKVVEIETEVE